MDGTTLGYVNTTAWDYADNSRFTRWGGIIIQRMYLEWTLHQLAVLRLGQYLTPYGIWNVDHGSPAYIPVQRPYGITNNWFPQQQTGFELFGSYDLTNSSTVGYHLTFSNGGGPVSEYRDLDENKAVGGRLYWELRGDGELRIGASGYYGRDTDATLVFNIEDGVVELGESISRQFDALNLAADIRFKRRWLLLQAEWMSQQRRFTPEGRTRHDINLASVSQGYSRDSLSWSGYALGAVTLPWYGLTPYVIGQYSREVMIADLKDVKLELAYIGGGLNIRPTDAVTFKVEGAHSWFVRKGPFFHYPINAVQLQAAWAF